MRLFHPLEVVGRGSETQPHVVENLNKLTIRVEVDEIICKGSVN